MSIKYIQLVLPPYLFKIKLFPDPDEDSPPSKSKNHLIIFKMLYLYHKFTVTISYLTILPVGSSPGIDTVNNLLSSSEAAHNIIPSESSPFNFTGFKFATTTTYLPKKFPWFIIFRYT